MAEMLERTQMLMGTFVTIALPQESSKELQKSFEILRSVERSLSSYDPKADIYRLNHEREASISAYSHEAFVLSQRYYQESDGYFDITIGSITKELYRFGEDERSVSRDELQTAKVGFKGLHFNTKRASLDSGVTIDLGGMGKGFGVDKVAVYLKEQNIIEGRIALSGDIRCLDICKMAIQNPFGEGEVATFTTKEANTAISTSGNYRRYIKDRSQNHLIDPKRKHAQQVFASITLVSHGANSDIDAYATAASVMPLEKAISFLDGLGVGYVLITNAGEQYINDEMDTFVDSLRFTKRMHFECETE
ncbi:MAG: FAD:protein FMN transferase [Deltaproteobacteria bacterium]|nr:MAG: FAD:protein FMN transferase [Deltaproteobacteria bacterium]